MERSKQPTSFAGSDLGNVRHVCAFFNSDDEEYDVLIPFIIDGFECGDKAVHLVNPGHRDDHLQRLTAVGIDSETAERSGQLEIRTNSEEYIRDGRFDQERMLETFDAMCNSNARLEFPHSRIICRMDWVADDKSYVEDIVEFESRVNDVWLRHDDMVICTYHLGKFGGETVVDIIRTHPIVIIGGILQHNPFYAPPDVFLRELHQRRDRRHLSASSSV